MMCTDIETELRHRQYDDDNIEENNFPTSELDQLLNDFTNFDDDDGNELFPDLFDVDFPTDNDEISEVDFIPQESQNTDFSSPLQTPTISPMVNLPFVDKKDIKWDMKPMVFCEFDIQQP
ncbi:hypothetical protein FWK35_00036261, partial [Aphis craccivora]